ncbi:O14AG protein, partial [Malurus elegans]|nr:O14AG protein [Malurus elegans]
FGCFVFILFYVVQLFRVMLRIQSEQGQHKALSMCFGHWLVSLLIRTSMFVYLKPPFISSPLLDLMVSVVYSVVPPTLNPFIYSLRH